MNTLEKARTGFPSLSELKKLLAESGPCLSIYMPLSTASTAGVNPNAKQNALSWKECLRSLEPSVSQFGAEGEQLLGSLQDWASVAPDGSERRLPGRSIAVFRSPGAFQVVLLESAVVEQAFLSSEFHIRPLLAEWTRERDFYLLALTQHNTRLLHCTHEASKEVPLAKGVHTSFEEWMNQVKPDHKAVNNAMASGRQGSATPNALAPKGADQDGKEEYLRHYFQQIDRGVVDVLRDKTATLVLCAVDYETALYRTINSYQHLACEDVKGAANGLKAGELHTRALQVVEDCYLQKIDAVLAEWNHRVGSGASSRLKEVVTAAHEGRVLNLVISESLMQTGSFDEETFHAKGKAAGDAPGQDLINDAAVQTLRHAGHVWVAPQRMMPQGSPVAAVYRY